jgi:hypothetical protein
VGLLTEADLDKRATHQRLPDYTEVDVDDYGDQDQAYATLETEVPIRIEQQELQTQERAGGDVLVWNGFVLPTIANPPTGEDRFVIGTRTFRVLSAEGLTDLTGDLDHYEMDLEEIALG